MYGPKLALNENLVYVQFINIDLFGNLAIMMSITDSYVFVTEIGAPCYRMKTSLFSSGHCRT